MKYLLAAVALLVLGGGIYLAVAHPFNLQPAGGVACTEEAMQCPDGSSVARQGPDCAFAPCPAIEQSHSGIQGVVLLGPTCPVERNPPDPQCADKKYQTSLALMTADGTKVIKIFSSDASGKFMLQAVPGTYTIGPSPAAGMLPRCSSSGVISVSIGAYTNATVYCDTGIR